LGEYLSVGQQKDLALMLLEEDHTGDPSARRRTGLALRAAPVRAPLR
jgi:hypothetical protein